MFYPLIKEILYQNPLLIFSQFANCPNSVFLDSAQRMKNCGRFSFIAVDPFLTMKSKNGIIHLNDEIFSGDPFQLLEKKLSFFSLLPHADLPPFQGGMVGFFSYDLYQHLENIAVNQLDDMEFPDLAVGFYDLVIAFDHEIKRAWIFSSGYPITETKEREMRATIRAKWLIKEIEKSTNFSFTHSFCQEKDIHANFSQASYETAVQTVKEYILAGDIFEANISQRFSAILPENFAAFALYQRLREINPATFSAYLNFGDSILASASPERFLKLQNDHVETRPIKGTRSRSHNPEEDLRNADELMHSEKDRAENVMIVDLLRNDLSRVCHDHSVKVPQLCGLESYASVHHLVSVVTGQLQPQYSVIDLFRATFPGGSITGAPKIRALEIIAEIEPTRRGPYCGCIGYIGFDGVMDTSITIRTFAIKNNKVTFQAGGAVVLDSDPLAEYEETLTKARALRRALIE